MDTAKDILQNIFSITYSIIDCYNDLKKLETEGKTESNEFKNTINMLNTSLFLENSLYQKLGDDITVLTRLLAEIIMPNLAWDLDVDLMLAKENHNIDLINRRIILRLVDKLNQSGKKTPLSGAVIDVTNCSDETSVKFTGLSVAIRNDIINTILMFTNMQIEAKENEKIKFKLIEFKYNIGFLFEFVESDFMLHNFAINPNLYWISPAVADIEKIHHRFVNSYQKYYAGRLFNRPVENLLKTKKEDLEREDIYFDVVLSQILIRTVLLFGEKHAEINVFKTILKNVRNTNSAVDMIKEAYDMRTADLEIPQKVSLNL